MEKTVNVTTPGGDYPVVIAAGLLETIERRISQACPDAGGYIVITDRNVSELYLDRVVGRLSAASLPIAQVIFPAGEPAKTLDTFAGIYDDIFAAARPDRDYVIVALGGGVVGDMAGFVAATLLRGVRFVQAPTTLLAAVDSSVGGKTGVDHHAGKNLIGAFHQPRGVFMDPDTLGTLDAIELQSGLAECVKHACIRRPEQLAWLSDRTEALLGCDADAMAELIAWNVEIKAAVVSADEREAGQRAHLNFGHTIGHAIEAEKGMDAVTGNADGYMRHGHCVSLGMVAACRIAVARNQLPAEAAATLEALLAKIGLPVRVTLPSGDTLLEIMRRDKKNRGGRIRFVLPEGDFGRMTVVPDVTDDEIASAIDYLRD